MLTPAKQSENQATKPTATNGSFFGGGGGSPFFQAKLTVNSPGDAHERDADVVADQVMRMPSSDLVQRQSVSETEPSTTASTGSSVATTTTAAQPSTCQQNLPTLRADALTWLDDIYTQLLDFYVDVIFQTAGQPLPADTQRVGGALRQAFNTDDLAYVEIIRRRFLHIANMLREPNRVTIQCSANCASYGSGVVMAFVNAPYEINICGNGTPSADTIATLIHELGHAVVPQIGISNTVTQHSGLHDRAYAHERLFAHLPPMETLDNAESYGILARLLHDRANTQMVTQYSDTAPNCSQPDLVLRAFARADHANQYGMRGVEHFISMLRRTGSTSIPSGNTDFDIFLQYFPTITTLSQMQTLKNDYQGIMSTLSGTSWDFHCVASSTNCRNGTVAFNQDGTITNNTVTQRRIRNADFSLCPDWDTLSADDKARTIYALYLLAQSRIRLSTFPPADIYKYVEFAFRIESDNIPAVTLASPSEHIAQDQTTQPLTTQSTTNP
jgi:hypothetical protein